MGVDAKLFVKISEGKKLKGIQTAFDAINKLYQEEFEKAFEESPYDSKARYMFNTKDENNHLLWSLPSFKSQNGRSFSLNFRINGEYRKLFIMTDIESDHKEFIGEHPALWFSLGYWGSVDKIMKSLIEPLKELGNVYYDFNDCDDKDFELM